MHTMTYTVLVTVSCDESEMMPNPQDIDHAISTALTSSVPTLTRVADTAYVSVIPGIHLADPQTSNYYFQAGMLIPAGVAINRARLVHQSFLDKSKRTL